MPLFTDGSIAGVSDLKAYESSILDTANTEGIALGSKLEIAQREIGLELTAFLLRRGVSLGAHRELSRVVVTEPLLHVHALHTLALIYRDAYNTQVNDRYLGKWKEYGQLSERALRQLLQVGIGMTNGPVPKAAEPVVNAIAGSVLPAADYVVRIGWVTATGATGALSDTALLPVDAEKLLTVSSPAGPAGINLFHVYAAAGEDELLRQTAEPLAIGQTWIQPTAGLLTGLPSAPIQRPDYYVTDRREWLRG